MQVSGKATATHTKNKNKNFKMAKNYRQLIESVKGRINPEHFALKKTFSDELSTIPSRYRTNPFVRYLTEW
jgi:hypothetical protein